MNRSSIDRATTRAGSALALLLGVTAVLADGVLAQPFEGRIQYRFEDLRGTAGDGASEASTPRPIPAASDKMEGTAEILAGPSRILIRSAVRNLQEGPTAEGVLIRNDLRDVVIFSGGSTAVRLTRSELSTFMQMVDAWTSMAEGAAAVRDAYTGQASQAASGRWIRTDERRVIHGMPAVKWRGRDDNAGQLTDLWLAEDRTLDWTFFSGTWTQLLPGAGELNVGPEIFFENGSVPLLVEIYRDRTLAYRIQAETVDTEAVDPAVFDIPGDKQVIGLSELMMRMLYGG